MIAILLGTYNGGRFLSEQLNSLFTQTVGDFHLYIRDDGSTDNTLQIIQRYMQMHKNITLLGDRMKNMGVKQNFEYLLDSVDSDYYMFCDQDDVWLPDKIEVSLAKIKQMEQHFGRNVPLLLHSDLEVVDENLNLICDSFWRYANIHPQIVDKNIYYQGVSNSVTGCTIMINKKAKEVSLPFPKQIFMHDAWIALSVMKYGYIDYISMPTIKYRQHVNNVEGAVKYSLKCKFKTMAKIYADNKRQYSSAHPLVFKNVLHYLICKCLYLSLRFRYNMSRKDV